LVIGLSALAFLVTAGVAVLAVAVVRPLAALRASARAITSGDVKARAKASGPEEVASPARGFNEMTDALSAKTDEESQYAGFQVTGRDITERKRAEELARQAEQRYRDLFEGAPVMYVITRNQDGAPIVADCNELFLSTLGYARAEVLERPLADFYTPESRAELLERGGFQRALKGQFVAEERQLLTRDGRVVQTLLRALPEADASGNIFGTRAMYVDITERKRAEEALRESEQSYRLLAENVTDVIWAMDTNLRFTYVSPSVTRLRGYTVEEAMAQTLAEILTPASLEVAMKALAEERAVEKMEDKDLSRPLTLELEQTCEDGSTVWTEVKMTALRGEDKRPVGILGVGRDITERRRAEEALRDSERRFRTLSEATFEGIAIHKKGRILDANQTLAEMFGYQLSEIVGMRPVDFVAPEYRDLVLYATLSGYEEPFELIGLRKDGSTFPIEACGKATLYRGQTVGVAAIRDISERKRAEEALQKVRDELESRVERRMQHLNDYGLTFRELAVLHLVAAGESDKEIAGVLGISPLTAHKHLGNILEKMGAACRTEAGVRALREGLLD
ncbi:MAG: PAS domain S-box protein, partial [Dehalococcoidia bacterium]